MATPIKRAIQRLVRGDDGRTRVILIDLDTGLTITDPTGYKLVSQGSLTPEPVASIETPEIPSVITPEGQTERMMNDHGDSAETRGSQPTSNRDFPPAPKGAISAPSIQKPSAGTSLVGTPRPAPTVQNTQTTSAPGTVGTSQPPSGFVQTAQGSQLPELNYERFSPPTQGSLYGVGGYTPPQPFSTVPIRDLAGINQGARDYELTRGNIEKIKDADLIAPTPTSTPERPISGLPGVEDYTRFGYQNPSPLNAASMVPSDAIDPARFGGVATGPFSSEKTYPNVTGRVKDDLADLGPGITRVNDTIFDTQTKPKETVAQGIISGAREVTPSTGRFDDVDISKATPARMASLGLTQRTPEQVARMMQTIAGEMTPAAMNAMVAGDPVAQKEFANIVTSMENRAANKAYGPLSKVTSGAQYDSLDVGNLGVTNANYKQYSSVLKDAYDAYTQGLIAPDDYGITNYYNADLTTPDWGVGQPRGMTPLGVGYDGHIFGSLPEYNANRTDFLTERDRLAAGQISDTRGYTPSAADRGIANAGMSLSDQYASYGYGKDTNNNSGLAGKSPNAGMSEKDQRASYGAGKEGNNTGAGGKSSSGMSGTDNNPGKAKDDVSSPSSSSSSSKGNSTGSTQSGTSQSGKTPGGTSYSGKEL